MLAQVIVIGVGGITLILTAFLVAPALFADHLSRIGEDSPEVQHHAQDAFESSFTLSLAVATIAAVAAAGALSWFLTRRVAQPIEDLAGAAESVADGDYAVHVPSATFGRELTALSQSFQRMADQLADTDAARSRLLADLAHEIRTPLSTLEAYIDGMEDRVVATDTESFATMRAQVARLRRLTGDIKVAAAASEHALHLTMAPTDIGSTVTIATAAAKPRYQAKDVALTLDNDLTGNTPVLIDADRIQQVLANLLDNALRHTPPEGAVTVHAASNPRTVTVTVTDTGDGIPTEQLETVFDRFHRVDPARTSDNTTGSGLGLTIARAIVVDHGGTLTAHSAGPGTGSTFTITLPRPTATTSHDQRSAKPH